MSCDNYTRATRLVKEFINLSEGTRFLRAVKSVLNENDMPDDDQLLNAILELHMDDVRSFNADITHIHLVSIFQTRNIFFQNINNVKGADMVEMVNTRNRTLERVLSTIVFIHVLIKQEKGLTELETKNVNNVAVKPDVNIQDTVADMSTVSTVLTCVLIGVAIGLFIACVF
jgi:hypothetical protein